MMLFKRPAGGYFVLHGKHNIGWVEPDGRAWLAYLQGSGGLGASTFRVGTMHKTRSLALAALQDEARFFGLAT